MAIYIFLLIGVIVAGVPLCSEKCGRSGRIIYCCAAAAVFVFVAAMRFDVGYDYTLYGSTYFNMQYVYPDELTTNRMEKGFLLPLYVLNLAFEKYTAVFVYASILIYPAVFYFIYKNSSNPWISVAAYLCLGLFFNSLCFMRQVIASLIVCYAMEFMDKKPPVRFFVLIFAASAFHWSTLIMLAMYFLLKIKPGYIYLGIISAGTIIFCIFSRTFMEWATEYFAMYNIYDVDTMPEASTGLSPKYTLMFGILFIICFVFRKQLIEKNPRNSIYINCLMYTVVCEAAGMRHAVLSRFEIVFIMPPVLYMMPDLVQVIKEYVSERLRQKGEGRIQTANIFALSCLSLYFAGCYTMLMLGNYNGVVPYASQIDKPYDLLFDKIITEEDYEEEDWDEDLDTDWEDEWDSYGDWYFETEPDSNGGSDSNEPLQNNEEPSDSGEQQNGGSRVEEQDEIWDNWNDKDLDDEDWDDEDWDDEDWDEDAFEQLLLDQILNAS